MYRPVCIGLTLALVGVSAFAQSPSLAVLDEIHALPKPKQQADLDTTRIVAIKREMAASAEERTSGLWQSWLVSVCNGCGSNQRTVAEIKAASDSYRRIGDERSLVRANMLALARDGVRSSSSDRHWPRIRFSELSTQGYGQIKISRIQLVP